MLGVPEDVDRGPGGTQSAGQRGQRAVSRPPARADRAAGAQLAAEFVPTLRRGLIDMLELLALRSGDPGHGDAGHAALVDAVVRGDGEATGRTLREELEETLARLRSL
ncbi:hypothetical protein ACWCQM_24375 [Streptomyces sp. NPDC002125]